MIDTQDLREKERVILKAAEQYEVKNNYLFVTTFARYQEQLSILEKLQNVLNTTEVLVTKEYVRGRENYYANPAIGEYNRTADSANKTAASLMKIIKFFGSNTNAEEDDPILTALNGGD